MYTFFYDFIEKNKKYHILYFLFFLSRLHKKVYMVYTNTQKYPISTCPYHSKDTVATDKYY